MTTTASASEVQKNFGAYHDRALAGEAVRVTRYGRETVCILSAAEYHRLRQGHREVLAVTELTDQEMALIEAAEVPQEHHYHLVDET